MGKKALSIVWLLTGFMMVGYNVYMLDQLYQPSVIDVPELTELKSKLNSLSFLDSKKRKISEKSKTLFQKMFACLSGLKNKKNAGSIELKEHIVLPVIQGMLKSIDSKGRSHRLVMIDGKVYSEKQKVNGFIIEKISDNGIYLTKHEKKWFVKIPDVKFSIINE